MYCNYNIEHYVMTWSVGFRTAIRGHVTCYSAGPKGGPGGARAPPPPPRRGCECPKKIHAKYNIATIYRNA